MKKRTVGILATSVAVSALCVVTDVSAFARGGGGGFGGFHGGGGGFRGFHGGGGGGGFGGFHGSGGGFLLGFTEGAVGGMAADFMGWLPTVAPPTLGMGGV